MRWNAYWLTLLTVTFLTLSPGRLVAAQTVAATNTTPIWRLNVQRLGYTPPGHSPEFGTFDVWLYRIESICFLSDRRIAVTFLSREAPSPLPRRGETGGKLPFRLHALFLDSQTGQIQATREWPASSANARVLCTGDGKFVVFTPEHLMLYSPGLELLKQLDLNLAFEAESHTWDVLVSPAEKNLLVKYFPPGKDSPSGAWKLKLKWINLDALNLVKEWTATDITVIPDAISDRGMVILPKEEFVIRFGETPTGPWRDTDLPPSVAVGGGASFVNSETVFAVGSEGMDTKLRVSVALFSTRDEFLYKYTFPKGEGVGGALSYVPPVSANGQRFVLDVKKAKGGRAFFDIAPRWIPDRIIVFDIPTRQWIYTLDAKSHGIKGISGMALSPDGSLLALINQDGILEEYRITETSSPAGGVITPPAQRHTGNH